MFSLFSVCDDEGNWGVVGTRSAFVGRLDTNNRFRVVHLAGIQEALSSEGPEGSTANALSPKQKKANIGTPVENSRGATRAATTQGLSTTTSTA